MRKCFYICCLSLIFTVTAPHAHAIQTVTVLADKSISTTVMQLARNYSRLNHVVINTSFTSPIAQEAQILEGGAADILITPALDWIETLKTQGLVDIYSQTEIARNRLALVGPSDSPVQAVLSYRFPVAQIIRQLEWEPGFVVGNPQDLPEGIYSKEALRSLNVSQDLEPYTLYIKRHDQMIDMIRKRGGYGVFFMSTAKNQEGLKIIDVFPETSHQPIRYHAVVIAGDNMEEARRFLEYLKSKEVRWTLISNGFAVN